MTHPIQIWLVLLLVLLAGCKKGTTDVPSDSKNILVYNDQGVWQESAEAVKLCLEEDGRTVRFITVAELQQTISDAGMIIFPGCNPVEVNDLFGFTGRENLRDFVRRGGGFIGIGGELTWHPIRSGSITAPLWRNRFPSFMVPLSVRFRR